MSDSISISSDESTDSPLLITDEEWKQIEMNLQHISILEQDALEKMEQLYISFANHSNPQLIELQSIIEKCHEDSIQQIPHTNTITFGQLLLEKLS